MTDKEKARLLLEAGLSWPQIATLLGWPNHRMESLRKKHPWPILNRPFTPRMTRTAFLMEDLGYTRAEIAKVFRVAPHLLENILENPDDPRRQ